MANGPRRHPAVGPNTEPAWPPAGGSTEPQWTATPTPQEEQGQARARIQAAEVAGEDGGFGRAVQGDDHPQLGGAVATEERRGLTGQRPQRSGPAGPARGQRLRLSPASRQRRQSRYMVERRRSPSWGRQCPSTITSSGAAAVEERRGRQGSGPSAVARQAQPGGNGSGSARRVGSDDSRGTWSSGDTPPLGAGSASRRPPVERQRRRNGEDGGAAVPAQWPGGPGPGAAAPAQPGE